MSAEGAGIMKEMKKSREIPSTAYDRVVAILERVIGSIEIFHDGRGDSTEKSLNTVDAICVDEEPVIALFPRPQWLSNPQYGRRK